MKRVTKTISGKTNKKPLEQISKKVALILISILFLVIVLLILAFVQNANAASCTKTMNLAKNSILKPSKLNRYEESYNKYLEEGISACTSNIGLTRTASRTKQQMDYYFLNSVVTYNLGKFEAAKISANNGLSLSKKLSAIEKDQPKTKNIIDALNEIKLAKQ